MTFGLGVFDRTSFAGSLLPAIQGPAALGPLDSVVSLVARSAFGTFVVRTAEWTFDLAQRTLTVDLTGSYEIGPRSVAVADIGPVWLEVSAAVQAFHSAGDQQRYFGDEAVAHGQPVVDPTGNLVTVAGTGGHADRREVDRQPRRSRHRQRDPALRAHEPRHADPPPSR